MKVKKTRAPSEYAQYCLDLIEQCGAIGPCHMKFMMGGWAISIDGYNFAFMVDLGQGEELWLKTDSESENEFKKRGSSKFTYWVTFKGKKVERSLNYYSAPSEALDSPEEMRPFAEMALFSALKAKKR